MSKIIQALSLTNEIEVLNQYIRSCFLSDTALINEISEHLINAGGKRLRPAILLLHAKAWGYNSESATNLATIIEFIHTATLLHDDVVDDSLQRRGLQTANAVWGNAPSVLVGDFLYSRAFQLMAKENNLDIFLLLANVTNTIAEGEVEQLAALGNLELNEENYYRIIFRKTAILFAASAELGALIATKEDAKTKLIQKNAHKYGENIGMAFQIMDDVLDYEGDTNTLGKNIGDDLREGKLTLPIIKLFEKNPSYKQLFSEIANGDTSQIGKLTELLINHGCLDFCRKKALDYVEAAKSSLELFPNNPVKEALFYLADFSIRRNH